MNDTLIIILIVAIVFIGYVAGKVYAAMKKSERQWQELDRSKLKRWDDDED